MIGAWMNFKNGYFVFIGARLEFLASFEASIQMSQKIRAALTYQHNSNGYSHDINPGADSMYLGVEVSY